MRRHRAERLPLRIREDHAIILAWRPSAKPAHTIVNTPPAAPGVWGLKLILAEQRGGGWNWWV